MSQLGIFSVMSAFQTLHALNSHWHCLWLMNLSVASVNKLFVSLGYRYQCHRQHAKGYTCSYHRYCVLPNKHACLNKRASDFWIWLAVSQKILNRSHSNFEHLLSRYRIYSRITRVFDDRFWSQNKGVVLYANKKYLDLEGKCIHSSRDQSATSNTGTIDQNHQI